MAMSAIVAIIVSGLVAAWATRSLVRAPKWLHVADVPNERSLHKVPVPRTGGLAIVAAMAIGGIILAGSFGLDSRLVWIVLGALVVASISFLDDRGEVRASVRLGCHTLAALLLWPSGVLAVTSPLDMGVFVLTPFWGTLVVVIGVVWMTNLYNFMDGMDGFAAGMATMGFGAYALFGWYAGEAGFAALCAVIAAAAAGFLVFNFPPARIFMGDTGSSTLGFLAAALGLWGASLGVFELLTAILIFSPFIVDATVTLLRRLLRGEKVWQAHKSHFYQRLVQVGWGHRRTVLAEYLLMLACIGLAIGFHLLSGQARLVLLGVGALVYVASAGGVITLERRRAQGAH